MTTEKDINNLVDEVLQEMDLVNECCKPIFEKLITISDIQAQEFDRFFKAIGLDGEDISVDDAILKVLEWKNSSRNSRNEDCGIIIVIDDMISQANINELIYSPMIEPYAQKSCVQAGMITSFSEPNLYKPMIEEYKEPPVFKDKHQIDFFRGKKHNR